jgi:hypothetical protein
VDLDVIDRLYADDLLLTGVLGEPSCTKSAVLEEVARGRAERRRGEHVAAAAGKKVTTCAGRRSGDLPLRGDHDQPGRGRAAAFSADERLDEARWTMANRRRTPGVCH